MEKHGMISRMFVWGDPEPVYYDSTWIRAQHGGILFSEIKLGATVSEGEVLGYVADPITNEQHPIRASSDGRVIGMAVDQVVMAGFAAYHIGTEAQVPGE
jgi:predicted deacylase